jgi:hypothetical protein
MNVSEGRPKENKNHIEDKVGSVGFVGTVSVTIPTPPPPSSSPPPPHGLAISTHSLEISHQRELKMALQPMRLACIQRIRKEETDQPTMACSHARLGGFSCPAVENSWARIHGGD